VWIVISSAERLTLIREFRPTGAYDPRVNFAGAGASFSSVFNRLAGSIRLHTGLLLGRLASGLVLIVSSDTLLIMTVAWTVVAVTTLITGWLLMNGGEDGSHQMLTILSVAFAISLLLSFADGLPEAGLYFVGAQSCLAYGTAGVAKLISPVWRRGEAIKGVLSTRTHGIVGPAILMQRHSMLALATCWATITFEVAFILAPVMPQPVLISLLATAAIFHLMSAYVMGLNGFLWSFGATYPAILFLNQSVLEVV
jgi:hypothetical protein